ncbi:helix-turn-helix transcriptional regulator [Streptomyces vinaceus]|uniref:helix-turn-helix transcriptional regulator n=1 Tax=Streptomyces vinaceus TaxID=1960 RepID=UPI003685FA38
MVKPTRVTNTIRAQRFAQDEMTQAELARRIGVSRQTVIAIEQGRYSPSLEMAFQIAQVFGVPLDSVFQYAAGGGAGGTGTTGGTDDEEDKEGKSR